MPFRNIETHFSQAPQAKIKRSSFRYNKPIKTTFNAGELVPFLCEEVLPGDTFDLKLSKVIRLNPSLHPTMDNLYVDTYYFFVPNRFLWDNWTHFMGESDKAWTDNITYIPPHIVFNGSLGLPYWDPQDNAPQSLLNYLGIPSFGTLYGTSLKKKFDLSMLPINAYIKVWNDWFRSENLVDVCPMYTSDGILPRAYAIAYGSFIDNNFGTSGAGLVNSISLLPVAKYADYFTRALPQPQKGSDVLIPAGGDVILKNDWTDFATSSGTPIFISNVGGTPTYPGTSQSLTSGGGSGIQLGGTGYTAYDPKGTLGFEGLEITVNNLRLAMQTQRLLERDARGGTRYIELIKSHFNVVSPDLRLQRSEYLGGKRSLINMTEVIQTSEATATSPLGQLAGRSLTTGIEDSFIKSFTEHGFIIGVLCVRPDRTYSQGIEKMWSRFERLDYYFPVLANIGEMPIKNQEIYLTDSTESVDMDDVFGYQEAWAEYRTQRGRNTGYMQPGITGSLVSWTYADEYSSTPMLSAEWLYQGKAELDRTLAISSSTAPQFIADLLVYGKTVRPLPVYSIPGLVDHN